MIKTKDVIARLAYSTALHPLISLLSTSHLSQTELESLDLLLDYYFLSDRQHRITEITPTTKEQLCLNSAMDTD
jgi:hypothetical protein